MLIAIVEIQVKPEFVDAFQAATIENGRNSIKEPGIARFDCFRQENDPNHFVLIEVYRTAGAQAAHRETAHYQNWRDFVAPMMAEPRNNMKYTNVFPTDAGW
jgi:autoinducer 2-degrading protein